MPTAEEGLQCNVAITPVSQFGSELRIWKASMARHAACVKQWLQDSIPVDQFAWCCAATAHATIAPTIPRARLLRMTRTSASP